jgi:WD40 repeat protein
LWDATAVKLPSLLPGHCAAVCTASFPPAVRIVTASNDNTRRVWNAVSGETLVTLPGPAMFSPDGQRAVSGDLKEAARLWNTANGTIIATLSGQETPLLSGGFSSDGRRLVAGGSYGAPRLWDTTTGDLLAIVEGLPRSVRRTWFLPDDERIVTVDDDRTTHVSRVITLAEVAELFAN